jgi:hypothetical protein
MKLLDLTVTGAGDRWAVMNGGNVDGTYPSEDMARHAVAERMANEADEMDGLRVSARRGATVWWKTLFIH